MIHHYFNVQVMPPKNGKAGALSVADGWRILEDTIEVGDSEDQIGAKIAEMLRRLEHGLTAPPARGDTAPQRIR